MQRRHLATRARGTTKPLSKRQRTTPDAKHESTQKTKTKKSRDAFINFFASDRLSLLTDFLDEKTRVHLAQTSSRFNNSSEIATENYVWKHLKLLARSDDLQNHTQGFTVVNQSWFSGNIVHATTAKIFFPREAEIAEIVALPITIDWKIHTLAHALSAPMGCYLQLNEAHVKDAVKPYRSLKKLPESIKALMRSPLLQKVFLSPLQDIFKRFKKDSLWAIDGYLKSLLQTAPKHPVKEMLQIYFSLGVTPYSTCTDYKESVFALAVKSGNKDAVSFCIREGVDVNHVEEDQPSALMMAVNAGHARITQLLLENKADPNLETKNDGDEYDLVTPLLFAAKKGKTSTVKLLVKAKADVNRTTELDDSALSFACSDGNEPMLACLLKSDTLKKETLDEPMRYAVVARNHSLIRTLKQAGADCAKGIARAKRHIEKIREREQPEIAAFEKTIDILQEEEKPASRHRKKR